MTQTLQERLDEQLEEFGERYAPEHEYGPSVRDSNVELRKGREVMEGLMFTIWYWMSLTVGFLAITSALLYLTFLLLGKIIKYLGYWPMFIKALMKVRDERSK